MQAGLQETKENSGSTQNVRRKTNDKAKDDEESITSPQQQPAKPGTLAEREHRKWEESPINWPDNPYTMENVGKRKHLNHFLDSMETDDDDDDNNMTKDQEEENLCALPYISPSKDLERFKRDYYVPNTCKDETLNGFEEKVGLQTFNPVEQTR